MRRTVTTGLLPLFCCTLLLVCAPRVQERIVPVVKVERPVVPSALLACRTDPEPPIPESQRDVARYLVQLWQAGEDCRAKLDAVNQYLAAEPSPAN